MPTKIPNFNLNHFKVFMAVYETHSMTEAAKILHLTQSGVSQHMKALEEDLKTPLFSRVGRKLVPTGIAHQIHPDIAHAFSTVAEHLNRVRGTDSEPEGLVRIGMPIEFGTNVIVPKLSELGCMNKKIGFEITLDFASVVSQMLLDGKLDFAFVDEIPLDRRIQVHAVASENLLLCASRTYMESRPKVTYSQSYFENLDYIEYKGTEPILRRWMLHHLKRKNLKLRVRAHIMDVQAVARFIVGGLGVGVLPDHVIERMRRDGIDLHVFEGKARPLKNEIRLARLKDQTLTRQASLVYNYLAKS